MSKIFTAIGILLFVGGLAYHFAALRLFNLLTPKDPGTQQVANGVSYGTHRRQAYDVYAPDGDGPFPVLMFVYGGSWDSGRRQDYEFAGRAFAAQGYVAAVIDYRIVDEAHYPDFIDDTAMALAHVMANAKQWKGDTSRVFLVGHSAGGYNIMQSVLLPGHLERHGVTRSNIKAVAALAAPMDVKVMDFPITRRAFSRAPDHAATQPVNHARADAPPILLLHGRPDKAVGVYNSQNMTKALTAAGAKVELKIYEGVTHVAIMLALSKARRGSVSVLEDIVKFFKAQGL